MPGLINPADYTFGEAIHHPGSNSPVPEHPASECPDKGCPFGRTEREHKRFIAQVIESAESYWDSLTNEYNYSVPAEGEPSIAGRVEDFVGYLMNWSAPDDETARQPGSLRALYVREGVTPDRDNWPVIATPDQLKTPTQQYVEPSSWAEGLPQVSEEDFVPWTDADRAADFGDLLGEGDDKS